MLVGPTIVSLLSFGLLLLNGSACGGESDGGGSTGSAAVSTSTSASTGSGSLPELPNPCILLTAEEFTAATGISVTAAVDPLLPSDCRYTEVGKSAVGDLHVDYKAPMLKLLDGLVAYPPPGATFVVVAGIGEKAAVAGPPEGRALVVNGEFGFDYARASSATPASEEQLKALLQAIVAP
jgi:hypothetical protein